MPDNTAEPKQVQFRQPDVDHMIEVLGYWQKVYGNQVEPILEEFLTRQFHARKKARNA